MGLYVCYFNGLCYLSKVFENCKETTLQDCKTSLF